MPTSPSPRTADQRAARRQGSLGVKKPGAATAPAPRPLWPKIAIISMLAVLGVVLAALPASLIGRFLPPGVAAADFSGTIWHGSAGRLTLGAREAGAVEWHLHPARLLSLRAAAEVHWVKGGFVLDGSIDAGKNDLSATQVRGSGPISDLVGLGVPPGSSGSASLEIARLAADLGAGTLLAAVGEIDIADASSRQIGAGADLGSYALKFDDPTLGTEAEATASLRDTGGPLSLDATLTLTPKTRTALLSGTIKERGRLPEALRRELEQIEQLHARDAQGRIPVDLEFSF